MEFMSSDQAKTQTLSQLGFAKTFLPKNFLYAGVLLGLVLGSCAPRVFIPEDIQGNSSDPTNPNVESQDTTNSSNWESENEDVFESHYPTTDSLQNQSLYPQIQQLYHVYLNSHQLAVKGRLEFGRCLEQLNQEGIISGVVGSQIRIHSTSKFQTSCGPAQITELHWRMNALEATIDSISLDLSRMIPDSGDARTVTVRRAFLLHLKEQRELIQTTLYSVNLLLEKWKRYTRPQSIY